MFYIGFTPPLSVLGMIWPGLKSCIIYTLLESGSQKRIMLSTPRVTDVIRLWLLILICYSISVCIMIQFQPTALTASSGLLPVTLLPKHKADFGAFVRLIARCLILLAWKSAVPPSPSSWIKGVRYFVKLEKTRCMINGSIAKFAETLGSFPCTC